MFKPFIKKISKTLTRNPFLAPLVRNSIYFYLKILFSTYRLRTQSDFEIQNINNTEGIFYFWHQNIIAIMFFLFKNKALGHLIVSPSREGKIIGYISQKLGFKVIYESAYKASLKSVKHTLDVLDVNKRLFLVGDGSRGPARNLRREVKYIAAKSQLPLIFIDCHAKIALTFNSWDKFKLPLPFSKILINIHKPIVLGQDNYKKE